MGAAPWVLAVGLAVGVAAEPAVSPALPAAPPADTPATPAAAPAQGLAPTPGVLALAASHAALAARVAALEERLLAAEAAAARPVQGARVGLGAVEVAADEAVTTALAIGGPLTVRGRVVGEAVALGGPVTVLDGGVVDGSGVALGGPVHVGAGATLSGARVESSPAALPVIASAADLLAAGRGLARTVSALLGLAGAGLLVLALAPGLVRRAEDTLAARPVAAVGAGLAAAALGTGAAVILALSVVGLPVSALLVGGLALGASVGGVAVCSAVGERIPSVQPHGRWAAFLVGLLGLGATSLLPVVGMAVPAAALTVGLGAGLLAALAPARG